MILFRFILILVIFACIAWPLYKLTLRCVLKVKTELETEPDEELERQAEQLKEKKKTSG